MIRITGIAPFLPVSHTLIALAVHVTAVPAAWSRFGTPGDRRPGHCDRGRREQVAAQGTGDHGARRAGENRTGDVRIGQRGCRPAPPGDVARRAAVNHYYV